MRQRVWATSFALTAQLLLGCGQHTPALSGSWTLCISDSLLRPLCGTAEVGRATPQREGRWTSYFQFTHTISLTQLLGERAGRSSCGIILVEEDTTVTIQVGIDCRHLFEADLRNLTAEHLPLDEDSLVGAWYQSCYSGCTAHGMLRMIRRRRPLAPSN